MVDLRGEYKTTENLTHNFKPRTMNRVEFLDLLKTQAMCHLMWVDPDNSEALGPWEFYAVMVLLHEECGLPPPA